MNKKKIADSIIIRVGGGIREIPRKPADSAEILEDDSPESGIEQTDDVHSFGADMASNAKISTDRIIN